MSAQNTQPTDNRQIVQRFMDECWNQGNLNTVMELVANDCRYHDPVFPSLTSGAENIKNHIQTCRSGFPDLTFTTDDTIATTHQRALVKARSCPISQSIAAPIATCATFHNWKYNRFSSDER